MIPQELIAYVKSELSLGVPPETIKNALRGSGWIEADIASAFNMVEMISQKNYLKNSFVLIGGILFILLLVSVAGAWYFGFLEKQPIVVPAVTENNNDFTNKRNTLNNAVENSSSTDTTDQTIQTTPKQVVLSTSSNNAVASPTKSTTTLTILKTTVYSSTKVAKATTSQPTASSAKTVTSSSTIQNSNTTVYVSNQDPQLAFSNITINALQFIPGSILKTTWSQKDLGFYPDIYLVSADKSRINPMTILVSAKEVFPFAPTAGVTFGGTIVPPVRWVEYKIPATIQPGDYYISISNGNRYARESPGFSQKFTIITDPASPLLKTIVTSPSIQDPSTLVEKLFPH